MRRMALALGVLLSAACRKAVPPKEASAVSTRAVVAGVSLIDYDAQTGEFSCRAPGEWKALEDPAIGPRVMFFGPGTARYPHSVDIAVLRYPGRGDIRTPEEYRDSLRLSGQDPSPLETRVSGGRTEYVLHRAVPLRAAHGHKVLYTKREDVVMIPVKDGFFALVHSAPLETYEETLPVFEAMVASFRPKG